MRFLNSETLGSKSPALRHSCHTCSCPIATCDATRAFDQIACFRMCCQVTQHILPLPPRSRFFFAWRMYSGTSAIVIMAIIIIQWISYCEWTAYPNQIFIDFLFNWCYAARRFSSSAKACWVALMYSFARSAKWFTLCLLFKHSSLNTA